MGEASNSPYKQQVADPIMRRAAAIVLGEPINLDGLGVNNDPRGDDRALCAQTDPERFFPEKNDSTREAKKICAGCEISSACLQFALDNDERFGVWGGLSRRERNRLTAQAA